MDVYPVGDHLRVNALIRKHEPQNARLSLVKWAHGVEGVCSVQGSGIDCRPRLLQRGIRMADGDLDAQCGCLSDQFQTAVHFRRDRHLPDGIPGKLDESAKSMDVRRL